MLQLYDHQSKCVDELRVAMRSYREILLYAPCGFGKTVVLAYICWLAAKNNKRIIFAVHRKELIFQTAATFDKYGLQYSFIAAGRPCNVGASIFIASIPTLRKRLGLFGADLLIVDEAHLSMAAGWQAVIEHYKTLRAFIIGCTASPQRLDRKGLGHNFKVMVKGPSPSWLIENGFLSTYKLFAPPAPDMSGLHSLGGDYRQDEAAILMNKPKITGDAIAHWMKHAKGKKTVVYGVSIKHSEAIALAFREAGIPALHVDGETDEDIRMAAMRDLADGKILVVCNCMLMTEGVDLSALAGKDVCIECIVNLRPTQSLALWTQICGRGLRRKETPAIILDHAGASINLGLPDDAIDWRLNYEMPGKKDKAEIPPPRICPHCFGASRAGSQYCSICGEPFPIKGRQIDQVEGELGEVTSGAARTDRAAWAERQQEKELKYLTDKGIRLYGKDKGPRWANYVFQGRLKKKQKLKQESA